MQIVSNGDNLHHGDKLHEMSGPVFYENKEYTIYLLPAEFAQRVVKVNMQAI